MKKNIYLGLLAFLFVFLFSCKKSGKETTVQQRNLVQAIYASGKIVPLNDYKVFSKVPGYVSQILVKIGDSVKVGQPLLAIKSEVSELNANMAKNQLELAEKNAGSDSPVLVMAKQDVQSAKSKLELDSANFVRAGNLYKENAGTKQQLDQQRTQYDIAKQLYFKALNNYLATKDRLNTELQNAQLQYQAQVSNKNDFVITAAVSGMVYDIIPGEGDYVNNLTQLMEIGDRSNFEVELNVDETDVAFIIQQQDIAITIDAFKEKTFNGKVVAVYPRISSLNKTAKVLASITIPEGVKVYSGMSVEANIVVAKKENVLVIPREFIIGNNRVIRSENKDTVNIVKGAEDLEFVEVISGLKVNEVIIKP